MTSRCYVFTSFAEQPPTYNSDSQNFLVYQQEICPETQRKHWQGYVQFRNPTRLRAAQQSVGDPVCHMERSLAANAPQAIAYCQKVASRVPGTESISQGTPSTQGQRTDLSKLALLVLDSTPMREIALMHPAEYVKYHRGLSALASMTSSVSRISDQRTIVVLITGDTGLGKSWYAHSKWPDSFVLIDHPRLWADGYSGESTILMDEFCGVAPLPVLLRLMDRYCTRLETKGGWVTIASPRTVVMTSNLDLGQMYPGHPQWNCLDRRVTHIIRFTGYNQYAYERGEPLP